MITITMKGMKEVLKNLDPMVTIVPLRSFFERAGEIILNHARARAPVDTGRLVTSLGRGAPGNIWELDQAARPLWLKIGTNVTHRGISYPLKLEEKPTYHYRGGRAEGRVHRSATGARHAARTALYGQKTQHWFSGAAEVGRRELERASELLGIEIARRLNGGH
jgi:hypothetical protein